jgi:hypothetical protein
LRAVERGVLDYIGVPCSDLEKSRHNIEAVCHQPGD